MRNDRGVVKVADLGLARMKNPQAVETESALTQAGGVLGTVDYMAPEQAVDSTTIDHRADIYSLGCTLYFLLAGRPMYSGSSLMSLLLQHHEAPPPSLREVRPDVPDFLNAIFRWWRRMAFDAAFPGICARKTAAKPGGEAIRRHHPPLD
jgi:serine/threonine protein kinase